MTLVLSLEWGAEWGGLSGGRHIPPRVQSERLRLRGGRVWNAPETGTVRAADLRLPRRRGRGFHGTPL